MIKKWNEYIKEDLDGGSDYILAKLEELKDLVGNRKAQNDGTLYDLIYTWKNNIDEGIVVEFTKGDMFIKYELIKKKEKPVEPGEKVKYLFIVKKLVNNIEQVTDVKTITEGLEFIDKDIKSVLGINESNRIETFLSFNEEKSEKYKGHKIPGKYLTRKKGAMKKEIDTFRGKKEYKKDWEADVDKRSGKRIKTKKSASTKAYQKMFGK